MVVNKSKRSKNSSAAGQSLVFYSRGWHEELSELIKNATEKVIIVSPYIRRNEAKSVVKNISKKVPITVITDISINGLIGRALEIEALEILLDSNKKNEIIHLPHLHAKIYVADTNRAVITSANLTASGIYSSYEYGVGIGCCATVSTICEDIDAYAGIGERVTRVGLEKRKRALEKFFKKRDEESKALKALLLPTDFLEKCKETEKAKQTLNKVCMYSGHIIRKSYKSQRSRRGTAQKEQKPDKQLDNLGKWLAEMRKVAILDILTQRSMTAKEIYEECKTKYPYLCLDTTPVSSKSSDEIWKHNIRGTRSHLKKIDKIKLEAGKWSLFDD